MVLESWWETVRTVLRPYTPADEEAFLRLWNDPVVQRLSFVEDLSPTRTEEFLQRTIESAAKGSIFFAVVEDKEKHEFIGHVSLNFKPPPDNDAAVGIALKGRYRGRGFGTELMRWLITHGFHGLGLHRISLTVMEDNIPALRMYKKIGFIDEGRAKKRIQSNGQSKDLICMGIVREEWDIQNSRMRKFT
ncbi:acyl-CoA N-acyltransferase [Multifurca ochricompacta]|uniref:Acyl-CoA N-acyltransferase n=1 Tax=Multifurca ochricompacta TaxID=376703 RepID=A0AAD4M7V3_9AGAM|nr:acyl-CoA N-acyltransferase [Multifurca ochricompacta]